MLDSIFETLRTIADFFIALGKFIFDLIEDLLYCIGLMRNLLPNLITYLGWLPETLLTLIVSVLTVAVVFRVVGR